MDSKLIALDSKMKNLAVRRQKDVPLLKLTSWALYHRSALKDFLEGIILLIGFLEMLFPAPQAQITLARQEAAELGDKQYLILVENAANGVDNILRAATWEVITGHQYSNFVINGQAHMGDAYRSDWNGDALGASHIYNGIEIGKDANVMVGNKYSGKD